MGFFELFSVRNNPKEVSDIYQYDTISSKFRVQIVHILSEIIPISSYSLNLHWDMMEKGLSKELGVYGIGNDSNSFGNIVTYMEKCKTEDYADCLDYIIHYITENESRIYKDGKDYSRNYAYNLIPQKIEEINFRFRQNSIGYEVLNGQLIRIDNQYIHTEVVKNAIQLIQEQQFYAVSEEFLKAHEHYKQGDYKDAIVNAGKAFESTMKTICSKKGYSYDAQRDTANSLIRHLFDNELIPSYMQNHIQGLKQALENSTHVMRNKNGGHGQGDMIVDIDDSIVRYTLNLCATNIVFLIERYKETI